MCAAVNGKYIINYVRDTFENVVNGEGLDPGIVSTDEAWLLRDARLRYHLDIRVISMDIEY